MRIRLVATPGGGLGKTAAAHLYSLDRSIFWDAPPVHLAGAYWWLVRDGEGIPCAFAGLRHYHTSRGMLVRAGVLPSARGLGLQRRLVRVRDAAGRRHGWSRNVTYTKACELDGTVSANNLIACGYRLFLPSERDDGWLWWYKDLLEVPPDGIGVD